MLESLNGLHEFLHKYADHNQIAIVVVLVVIAGYFVYRKGVFNNLDLRYASPPKIPTPTVEEVDLSKMTKAQIEVWARDNLDLELDRRRTKASMIEEVENTFQK